MTDRTESLRIEVNGEARTVPPASTVATLLAELAIDVRQVAVERNREIVRKADYATTKLANGDELEIVTFVGGG